ncbi:unnamed protein product [Darwinula stevensoni]|uniref:Translation initiation factor eIF2B subunit gamma n=1 Tax=Darwinula stevensoni TaxID=69355 RepID=A0A7R8ZXV1_9CRUS|nr:unnamed protein product [Darwinula stevensoni]CAG0880149.1 unnamed protein product [Darwinula stevensoni]
MDLQAVILAGGKGSRMTELTRNRSKALLPVGNFPLIYFPMKMLQNAGFDEVIVICQESLKGPLESLLKKFSLRLNLDVITIPDDDEMGTADALRLAGDRIKEDLLVVSCDVITDFEIQRLWELHKLNESSLTALLSPFPYPTRKVLVPGHKSKQILERDLVAIDPGTNQLIMLASEADFEESFSLKMSILEGHPHVRVFSNLTDAHVYILKKWLIPFLSDHSNMSMLKGEVIPYIVKKQFSSFTKQNPKAKAKDIGECIEEDEESKLVMDRSAWSDPCQGRKLRAFARIRGADEGFCFRVNTLTAFTHVNSQLFDLLPKVLSADELSLLKTNQSRSSPRCVIGDGTNLGERCDVKGSIVGDHCQIGAKVTISNCIIMDHVIINEGCVLVGSIICDKACIEENAEVRDSIVGSRQTISAKAKVNREVISVADSLLEI